MWGGGGATSRGDSGQAPSQISGRKYLSQPNALTLDESEEPSAGSLTFSGRKHFLNDTDLVTRPRIGQKPDYPTLDPEDKNEKPGAFSPGGRLLQIEYARDCPAGAPLALAFGFQDGVVLAKGNPAEPELGHAIPHIWRLTEEMAYVATGNLGDTYYLRDVLTDRNPSSPSDVARTIRSTLHDHAVRRDVRPLALMILMGSVEGNRHAVIGFDVTGSQWEADAWAIGRGEMEAREHLEEVWRADLNLAASRRLVDEIYGEMRHEVAVLHEGRE